MIALLVIGDEILSSQVRDENLSFMIHTFASAGFDIGEARIVRDEIDEIAGAFRELAAKYDYVVSAGGVGPTHDDVTLLSVAKAFNRELELNPEMLRFLAERHSGEMNDAVRRMASMPVGTEVTGADEAHWPIIRYENCFILPGLPVALRAKVERIVGRLPLQQQSYVARIFLNADESAFAEQLAACQSARHDITIGSYPVVGISEYRAYVTIKSKELERVKSALAELLQRIGVSEWIVKIEEPRESAQLLREQTDDG